MDHSITEIDHLLCAVQDAALAASDFERLGFTVTPASRIERVGIENRLVAFRPAVDGVANYIELMGAFDRSRLPPPLVPLLAGPEAVRCLMLGSTDAHKSREALLRQDIVPEPVHAYQRAWTLPSGEVLELAFDVLEPMPGPAAFGVCQHRTLHHYLRPEFLEHPNGAQRILAAYVVTQDPAAAGEFFGRLLGESPQQAGPVVSLARRAFALHFLDASSFAARFPGATARPGIAGYQIGCRSLEKTAAYLAQAGIQPQAVADGFHLCSGLTHGHLIHFTQVDA